MKYLLNRVSHLLSHKPIHHLLMCQDSGERSRALGPSCFQKEVVIKRAAIDSQTSMVNLTNALAVQIEQRDID